jgi:anti-anti-sigma factor
MELRIGECDGDVSRIALVGILDLIAVGQIETRLMAATVAHGRHAIIDLSELTFIASLGMGVLVTAHKGLKRKGARLVLLNPQADVEAALVAARLHGILPIVRGEAEALQYLAAD